jgi:hypothetical protein
MPLPSVDDLLKTFAFEQTELINRHVNEFGRALHLSEQYIGALLQSAAIGYEAPDGNPKDFSERLTLIAGTTQNLDALPSAVVTGQYIAAGIVLRWELEVLGRLIQYRNQHKHRRGQTGSYRVLPPKLLNTYVRLSEIAHTGYNEERIQEVYRAFATVQGTEGSASFGRVYRPDWADALLTHHLFAVAAICQELLNLIAEVHPEVVDSDWHHLLNDLTTEAAELVAASAESTD